MPTVSLSTAAQATAGVSMLLRRVLIHQLFAGILAPGRTESQVEKDVFKLAETDYGTRQHWHQRLPRHGENTQYPIFEERPDVPLQEGDICFLDLGPVFKRVVRPIHPRGRLASLQHVYNANHIVCWNTRHDQL